MGVEGSDWDSAAGWGGESKAERKEKERIERLKQAYLKKNARRLYEGSVLEVNDANEVFYESAGQEPKMLCGSLFRRGEIAVLFSDTGNGKSCFAVQMGEAIARGLPALQLQVSSSEFRVDEEESERRMHELPFLPAKDTGSHPSLPKEGSCVLTGSRFLMDIEAEESHPDAGVIESGRWRHEPPRLPAKDAGSHPSLPKEGSREPSHCTAVLQNEAGALEVLYADFEMAAGQFAERYSAGFRDGEWVDRYEFAMQRARIGTVGELPEGYKSFTDLLLDSIAREVESRGIDVLIVDNITYLTTNSEGSSKALSLMKGLKHLKDTLGLSILVIAHTPKKRGNGLIEIEHMQGSKMIANFADTVFAIGRSVHGEDMRYIKQLKARTTVNAYGPDNVLTCRLVKGAAPFGNGELRVESGESGERPVNFLQFVIEGFDEEATHHGFVYDGWGRRIPHRTAVALGRVPELKRRGL